MSMMNKAFDWRGFWADLLQGTGYGLLQLDGSDAAKAAMSGLDRFDAARRRRQESREAGWDEDGRTIDPSSGPQIAFLRDQRAGEQAQLYQPSNAEGADLATPDRRAGHGLADDPRTYDEIFVSTAFGLAPSARPHPLSANPYDYIALSPQVRFMSGATGRGSRRR